MTLFGAGSRWRFPLAGAARRPRKSDIETLAIHCIQSL